MTSVEVFGGDRHDHLARYSVRFTNACHYYEGMGNTLFDGRLRAYEGRHPGRNPFHDAFAGLLWAAPDALERWIQKSVVPTCRKAMRGKSCATFSPLPSWLRGIVLVHLHTQGRYVANGLTRLEDCVDTELPPESSYRLWANDRLLETLISSEPLSWLVELLNSHVALGNWQRDTEAQALARIVDSILQTALEFDGLTEEGEAEAEVVGALGEVEAKAAGNGESESWIELAPALMAMPSLEYCRETVVGMSAIKRKTNSKPNARDQITQRFEQGIEALFRHENLGTLSVADLTLLSLVSGFECDEPNIVRDRWKKRRRTRGGEKSDFPLASQSPAT